LQGISSLSDLCISNDFRTPFIAGIMRTFFTFQMRGNRHLFFALHIVAQKTDVQINQGRALALEIGLVFTKTDYQALCVTLAPQPGVRMLFGRS
jgi:hypothetical protein